ncbi:MAG TPA: site-specific DNA-methyltransferase [Candidatus Brocadiaceae bacterium]
MTYPEDYINKIICGDCLEVMKGIPNKSVDLVLTSPPYNTGNKSLGYHPKSKVGDNFYNEYSDNKTHAEYKRFITDCIGETLRIGRYSFWNFQMISNNKTVVFEVIQEYQKNLKDIFIWHKQAVSQIQKGVMAKGFEFVLMFGEYDRMVFDYNNFPENNYVPNIQEWHQRESHPEHHALFPLALPDYFIEYFTKPGDTVLDIFNGLGTTARSAKKLGRKYIGIEISKKYCEIAKRRLAQEYLFT